jgi:pyruvate, water dikinase
VRSSGESEDLAGASFAGQYDTFLWIRGIEDVLRHVRRCWSGMFGEAVLTYRPDGDPATITTDHGICVGVQQMVPARTAGVMFTLDPVTGDPSKIVIEGCWGLGEGVVKGDITPSRYSVDKVTFEIVHSEVTRQEVEYRFDPESNGVTVLPVSVDRLDRPCLQDEDVIALAQLAKRIAEQRGTPQDIEWAISDTGELRVLQVRPETVWSQRPAQSQVAHAKSALDHVLARFAGIPVGSAPPPGPPK